MILKINHFFFYLVIVFNTLCFCESSDIVMVSLNENSLDKLNSFPILRNVHGNLISKLCEEYQPKVIFVDIIIDRYCNDLPESDKVLFNSIKSKKKNTHIIFPGFLKANASESRNYHPGIKYFDYYENINKYIYNPYGNFPLKEITINGGIVGMICVFEGLDKHFNSMPSFVFVRENLYFSAPLLAYMLYAKIAPNEIFNKSSNLILKSKDIPVDKYGQFSIKFDSNFKDFDYFDIMNKLPKKSEIQGKIVCYRMNYSGTGDHFPTKKSSMTNGTELMAHAIQTLIDL